MVQTHKVKRTMEYRLGKLSDLDNICALTQDAVAEMEKHGIFQWDEVYPAREVFEEDISKNQLYVVIDNDELIAYYVISGEYDEQYGNGRWECDRDTSYILHRFCVVPKFQNRGFGKKILLHIEKQILDMGYRSVRLDVFTKNPFAQNLYRHAGYEHRGYADWRKGRFDLMEKSLMPCEKICTAEHNDQTGVEDNGS